MFFFKEIQTVRKRRGAITNLDLVYNSRNASIRHKGNFGCNSANDAVHFRLNKLKICKLVKNQPI